MAASLAAIAIGASANIHGHHMIPDEQLAAYDHYIDCTGPVTYPGDRPADCAGFTAEPVARPSVGKVRKQEAWEYTGAGIVVLGMGLGVRTVLHHLDGLSRDKNADTSREFVSLASVEGQPERETILNPYRLFREEPELGRQIVRAYVSRNDSQPNSVS